MKKICNCNNCGYCKAYSRYEDDKEFGKICRSKTTEDKMVNFLHFLDNEENCKEFGEGRTSLDQRRSSYGEFPSTEEIGKLLNEKNTFVG
jgi:hypothetical protein